MVPAQEVRQRLEKSVSFYLKGIDFLFHQGRISEKTAYAFQVLIYINANSDVINNNHSTYIATAENDFICLLDAAKNLLQESKEKKLSPDSVILENLTFHLYRIFNLLKEKNVNLPQDKLNGFQELINKINKNFHDISDNLFRRLFLPPGAEEIRDAISPPRVPEKNELIEAIKNGYQDPYSSFLSFYPKTTDGIQGLLFLGAHIECSNKKLEKFKDKVELSGDRPNSELYRLILIYVYRLELPKVNFYYSMEDIIKLIKTHAASALYADKPEDFVNHFLLIYRLAYEDHITFSASDEPGALQKSSTLTGDPLDAELDTLARNSLLEGMLNFLPALDALLAPNQLSVLIEHNLNNYFLKYAGGKEEDEKCYAIYLACLSFYINLNKNYLDQSSTNKHFFLQHFLLIFEKKSLIFDNFQASARGGFGNFSEQTTNPPALPPTFQMAMNEENHELQNEFAKFVRLFLEVNSRAAEFQQRNVMLFFSKHQPVMMQLIGIMGIPGIKYLHAHLAETVLNLERKLTSLPLFSKSIQQAFTQYFEIHEDYFLAKNDANGKNNIDMFINIFIVFDALINENNQFSLNYTREGASVADCLESLLPSQNGTPTKYFNVLLKHLLNEIFGEIKATLTDEEISSVIQQFPVKNIIFMIASRKSIVNDQYRLIYLHLLKCDLTGQSSLQFLHAAGENDGALSLGLSRHNRQIRDTLLVANFDLNTLLHYLTEISFVTSPISNHIDNANHIDQLFDVMIGYILQLKEVMNEKKCANLAEFEKLYNLLKSFDETIKDKEICNNIHSLLSNMGRTQIQDIDPRFFEFSQHIKDQYSLIRKAKVTLKNEKKEYKFIIQQWDKTKSDTFFLGDEVGCCLASSGVHFQAIVQRRMDDAMLFHVAIDEKNKRVAALAWLYLAETVENDIVSIVLVANFFEINAKYATNDSLRLALLNQLLQFTAQYCQTNKITRFFMAPLKYGWFRNDLKNYPLKEVVLRDKVGGAYDVSLSADQTERKNPSSKDHTQARYFLHSLGCTMFHEYPLTEEGLASVVPPPCGVGNLKG